MLCVDLIQWEFETIRSHAHDAELTPLSPLTQHSYLALPCPPLFDGDYWPEEMARLAQALRRRALAQLTGGKQSNAAAAGPAGRGKGGGGSKGSMKKGGVGMGPVATQAYFFGTTPWHLSVSLLKVCYCMVGAAGSVCTHT